MLKVGDKVRIRKDLSEEMKIEFGVICPMVELAGSTQEVVRIFENGVQLKNVGWNWHEDMFEPVTHPSIHITTDGTTVHAVQKKGGKVTGRAKVAFSPTDTFETGAKLAMERLWGSGAREVKRPAKVGEWVKIVKPVAVDGYSKGDIFKVKGVSRCSTGGISRPHIVLAKEYVVLENYTPPKAEPPKSEPEPIKFTFAEFKAGKFAVHCDTEAKSREFLAYLQGKGLRWRGGQKPTEWNCWERYKTNTCYANHGSERDGVELGPCGFYKDDGYTVIPYNAADLD